MRLVLRHTGAWLLRHSGFQYFASTASQDKKLRLTVLDTTQSVLRDMTIHEYLRHPQGMIFKDITKDMILNMIWIRYDTAEKTQLLLYKRHARDKISYRKMVTNLNLNFKFLFNVKFRLWAFRNCAYFVMKPSGCDTVRFGV